MSGYEQFGCDCRSVGAQPLVPHEEYVCRSCHRLWKVEYIRGSGTWQWQPIEG